MANFNKVILAGNLTRDPELRYTPKGTAIAKIGLAINRTWKNEAGETKEYLKKGRPILVEGRLKLDTWEDKQTNQKKSKLGVVAESFQFIDGNRGAEASPGGSPRPARAATPPPEPNGEPEPPPVEDDVPF